MKNLIGQRFGKLTVLELDKNKNGHPEKPGAYWKCKCDCGNMITVRGNSLSTGSTKSCGCLSKEKNKKNIDMDSLIGKKFGKLTVMARDLTSIGHGRQSKWICKCDCGNNIIVARSSLINEATRSCGCLKKETNKTRCIKDISGQRFGKLIAIKRTELQRHGSYIWECECDCGNICYYSIESLNSGKAISCGCVKSKGELKIKDILINNHIKFISEYVFKDFPNRRYDFAILNNNDDVLYLIEFDGNQHHDPNSRWFSLDGVERDRQKDFYALSHNIPLYRIPCQYEDKITLELLTENQFLIKI